VSEPGPIIMATVSLILVNLISVQKIKHFLIFFRGSLTVYESVNNGSPVTRVPDVVLSYLEIFQL